MEWTIILFQQQQHLHLLLLLLLFQQTQKRQKGFHHWKRLCTVPEPFQRLNKLEITFSHTLFIIIIKRLWKKHGMWLTISPNRNPKQITTSLIHLWWECAQEGIYALMKKYFLFFFLLLLLICFLLTIFNSIFRKGL